MIDHTKARSNWELLEAATSFSFSDIENLIVLCSGCHQVVHCSMENEDLRSMNGSIPECQYKKLEKLVNRCW